MKKPSNNQITYSISASRNVSANLARAQDSYLEQRATILLPGRDSGEFFV
jgi:hypothetical protein